MGKVLCSLLTFFVLNHIATAEGVRKTCVLEKLNNLRLPVPFESNHPDKPELKSKALWEKENEIAPIAKELATIKNTMEFQSYLGSGESPLLQRIVEKEISAKNLSSTEKSELESLTKKVASPVGEVFKKYLKSPEETLRKMSFDEMGALKERGTALTERLDKETAELRNLQEKDKATLLAWGKNLVKTNPEFANTTQDILTALSLQLPEKDARLDKIVSLVLGSGQGEKNAQDEKEVRKMARHFSKNGYKVIYDADSIYASTIQREAGKNGIGITAHKPATTRHTLYQIQNPHARMQVLSQGKTVFVSPDSVNGIGVLILKKKGVSVFDPKSQWDNGLANWAKTLGEKDLNQGISYEKATNFKNSAEVERVFASKEKSEAPSLRVKTLEELNYDALLEVLSHSHAMWNGERQMPLIGGAVYYGSAGFGKFDPLVEDVATRISRRGVTATTGGAGGSMVIVNHAAYAAGANSVGIPIAGRHSLSTEKVTYTDFHSKTIPASSYDSRVPLLMRDRELVVVNPGGMGTAREVATILFDWAARPESKQPLLFVGKEYYEPLVGTLLKSGIAPRLKDRVAIVDSGQEAEQKVDEWIEKGFIKKENFQTFTLPKPISVKPLPR